MADPRNLKSTIHVQYKAQGREMDKYDFVYLPDALDTMIDLLELDHVRGVQLTV